MAEQLVKLFSKDLQKNLFPSNEFYKNSKVDGAIEANAKTVEVPQSGTAPTVLTNPSSFPLTASQRTDDVLTYSVDLFATSPIHIEDVNEAVINYSKRMDILSDNIFALNTRIANVMAYKWATDLSANIVKTTGGTRPASIVGGAAKKALTLKDLITANEILDLMNVPNEGRLMLVTPQMYTDLLGINEFISFEYSDKKPMVDGQIGTILGMKVFKRTLTARYDNAFALKGVDDAVATTDRDSALIWHPMFVRRAEGTIKAYADIDNPTMLGSIFSAAVRAGGTIGRTDQKGVISIVQETF